MIPESTQGNGDQALKATYYDGPISSASAVYRGATGIFALRFLNWQDIWCTEVNGV